MSTEAVLAGGCRCGRVRYAVNGAPFHPILCHCADCRRSAGAPMVAWFSVADAGFAFTAGEPRIHRSSEEASRAFCGDCGTALTYRNTHLPDELDVTTASLDDPARVPPAEHMHVRERLPWVRTADGLPENQAGR